MKTKIQPPRRLPMPQAAFGGAACLIASLVIAPPAEAQIYRWKDPETGAIVMSNNPPSDKTQAEQIRRAPTGAPAGSIERTSAADPQGNATPAKAESQAGTPCEIARRNIATLESNRPVTVPDGKGGETKLDANGRAAQLAQNRDYLLRHCDQ